VEFLPMWYIKIGIHAAVKVVHGSTYVNLDMKYLKLSFPFVDLKVSYPPTSTLTSPDGIFTCYLGTGRMLASIPYKNCPLSHHFYP